MNRTHVQEIIEFADRAVSASYIWPTDFVEIVGLIIVNSFKADIYVLKIN